MTTLLTILMGLLLFALLFPPLAIVAAFALGYVGATALFIYRDFFKLIGFERGYRYLRKLIG